MKIVFAGPGNTGKSTIIKELQERFEKDGRIVKVYNETAREVLKLWFKDMALFQWAISKLEDERLVELKEDIADVILIDRTAMDWLIYSIFNMDSGCPITMNQTGRGEYDVVILFTEVFKETQTKQFAHYNDGRLLKLFRDVFGFLYGDKMYEFRNAGDVEEIKKMIDFSLNNKWWQYFK